MAPLGSFTNPEIEPKSDCANARLAQSNTTSASPKARKEHTRFILFCLLFVLRTNLLTLLPAGTRVPAGSGLRRCVCSVSFSLPLQAPCGCTRVQDTPNYTGKAWVSRGKKGGKCRSSTTEKKVTGRRFAQPARPAPQHAPGPPYGWARSRV